MVCFLSGKDFDLQLPIEHGRSGLMVAGGGFWLWDMDRWSGCSSISRRKAIITVRSRTQTAVHLVWDLCTAQCKAWVLCDQQWKGSCVHYSCSCLVNKGIRDSCKMEWNKSMNSCETLYNLKNLHNMPFPTISLTSVILYLWQCFACISNN